MSRKTTFEECKAYTKERGFTCLSTEYKSNMTRMKWLCDTCGHEWPAPYNRLKNGHGCPKCAKCVKHTIEECRELAKRKGWECLEKEYINAQTKMKWRCAGMYGNKHTTILKLNTFLQNIDNELGCQYCDRDRRSVYKEGDRYCIVGHNEYFHFKPVVEKLLEDYELEYQFMVDRKGCANPYYVDFAVPELKLVIEYDEKHHTKERDSIRQKYIEDQTGFTFIRIDDKKFMNEGYNYLRQQFNNILEEK